MLRALLEQGVWHEPDLRPADADEWGVAQFGRIFFGRSGFDLERVGAWFEAVEAATGIDGSEVRAILASVAAPMELAEAVLGER